MNKKTVLFTVIFIIFATVVAAELPIGVQRVIEHQTQLALSVTFLIAFIAGILTFTSPCGFALLPMFFTYLFKERKRAVLMTVAFTTGLMIAFTLMGILAGFVGDFFNPYKNWFAFISGFILILFGILLFLNKGFTIFNFRIDHFQKKSFFSIFAVGFFFGIGWTPCIGPILGGILFLAANQISVVNSALMLIVYTLGISFPLIIIAYFSDRFDWAKMEWLTGKEVTIRLFGKKVITHTYNIIGSILLILIGLIMVFYKGTQFFSVTIPEYTPWTMAGMVELNRLMLGSQLFTSGFMSFIGLIIIVVFVILVGRYLMKKR